MRREEKTKLESRIGARLRKLRGEAGLTLRQMADATELSPPFLSRIERGQTMPSIPTLQTIADALKVDIEHFFRREEWEGFVIDRPGERKALQPILGNGENPAYLIQRLTTGVENQFMEPALVTLNDRKENVPPTSHNGQEFMYVIEGRIHLFLGRQKFILKKGDAAYWKGEIPHLGVSLSKKPAQTLNVHFVPGQRLGSWKL
jgi:transcriptional regulator with XRE-family HTH domain